MASGTSSPRKKMLYSLRVRLLLTMIVVVAVAVGAVAVLASHVTASELQRYVDLDMQRNQRVMDTLIGYYQQDRRDIDIHTMTRQMSEDFGERVILTDTASAVQADSANELIGQTLSCDATLTAIIVTEGKPNCVSPPDIPAMRSGMAATKGIAAGDILFFSAPIEVGRTFDSQIDAGGFPERVPINTTFSF